MSISDGVLRLNREEKTGRESLHIVDARLRAVAVHLDDHVPDEGEDEPAREGARKH